MDKPVFAFLALVPFAVGFLILYFWIVANSYFISLSYLEREQQQAEELKMINESNNGNNEAKEIDEAKDEVKDKEEVLVQSAASFPESDTESRDTENTEALP